MLTIKQGIALSAILDKLDLRVQTSKTGPDGKPTPLTQEEIGADFMLQLATKAHKAENEIYAFVASIKRITPDQAQDVDLMSFAQEMLSDAGALDFFKSAVKSKGQR